ncbi:hypothetical protein SH501x_001430 [Pirellulaceae bacterium SH501]
MAIEIEPLGGLIRLATDADRVSIDAIMRINKSQQEMHALMFESVMQSWGENLPGSDSPTTDMAVCSCRDNGVVGFMLIVHSIRRSLLFQPLFHINAATEFVRYHFLLWYTQRYPAQHLVSFSSDDDVEWREVLEKFGFSTDAPAKKADCPSDLVKRMRLHRLKVTSRTDSEIGDACR